MFKPIKNMVLNTKMPFPSMVSLHQLLEKFHINSKITKWN